MALTDGFVFYQPDLVLSSFSGFFNMKKSGKLCDVVIKNNDSVFTAHRVILAAAIPYFSKMFTDTVAENEKKEVIITKLDSSALESLINFAYTSRVKIAMKNVLHLWVASEFLHLNQVRDSCRDFVVKKFHPKIIMQLRNAAFRMKCLGLIDDIDRYIRENFENFCETHEFLSLPFPFLNALIRNDELKVSSEEKVFDAVIRWAKADTERRQTLLPELLTGIRMTFLTPQFLINTVSKERLIMDSVPCQKLLNEVKDYNLLQEEEATGCSFTVSERRYGPQAGCGIFLFCCNKENGLTIFKYKAATESWITVLNDKKRFDLGHVLAVGDEIYVFSRFTFEVFDPRTLSWIPKKFSFAYWAFKHIVPCNGKIYWFKNNLPEFKGKSSRKRARSDPKECEVKWFDNDGNQWMTCDHSNFLLYPDDELQSSGSSIYILGSHSRFKETKRSNAMYDFQTQTTYAMPEMQSKRISYGNTVLSDTLYVCGGVSFSRDRGNLTSEDEAVLKSVEMHRFPQGWQTVSSMNIPRKNFSLVTYDKKLYAIGGTGDKDFVEFYDPASDKWTLAGGSLDGQYDFVKAVAISGEKK